MAFKNSIFGNNGQLTRDHITSSNFVAGVSGWEITRDGHAEFNDITIRGNGAGTPVVIGPSTGSQVTIGYNGAQSFVRFPQNSPKENFASQINGAVFNSGLATEHLSLQVRGPSVDDATDRIELLLDSQNNDGTSEANVVLRLAGGSSDALLSVDKTAGFNFYKQAQINMLVTNKIPLDVETPSGQTADLFQLRVNATAKFRVNAAGDFFANNIESGTAQTPAPGGAPAQTFVDVTFAHTFPSVPNVQVTPNSSAANLNTSNIRWAISNKTTGGFRINCWRDTNNATNFEWFAHV